MEFVIEKRGFRAQSRVGVFFVGGGAAGAGAGAAVVESIKSSY